MGYLDGLTGAAFTKDTSGNTLFYPWGAFGSGFIIDSEAKRDQIFNFYKKMCIILFLGIIVMQLIVGFWVHLTLFPLYYILYYFIAKRITHGLRETEHKLRISYDLSRLIFCEVAALGFVAIGIWFLQIDESPFIAYSSIIFFGLCAVVIGHLIVAKFKNK